MTTTPTEANFSGTAPEVAPLSSIVPPSFSNKAAALYANSAVWLDRRPTLRGFGILAVTALGLTLLFRIFNRVIPTADDWAVYWPFDAIVIAVLLMLRRQHWPWVVAGFVCAFLRIELLAGDPISDNAVDITGNALEIVAAAFALPPFRSLKKWMMEPRLFLRFTLFAVLLVPVFGSVPVAWYFDHRYHFGFWHVMTKWGFTDILGMALWVPFVLVLFSRETYRLLHWRAVPETMALLGALFVATWFTFAQQRYPIGFLPYPFLLLVALRLGFSGAVIGANMLALVSASLSLHGHGPFTTPAHAWNDQQTVILQIYSTLAMLFVLPLSVMLIERQNFADRLQQAYADMKRLATIDTLTGVANRRRFDDSLNIEWNRAARAGKPIALLMIDADCFKLYNDRYGHIAGDECLRKIASALSAEQLRPQDLVARYGGEEFIVLLPGAASHIVRVIAEQIRRRVYELDVPHDGNPHGRVTISVGCASIVPAADRTEEELIATADRALYAAKANGRNRVETEVPDSIPRPRVGPEPVASISIPRA